MAFFSRLRCHFCGTRSQHSKGRTQFQCTQCEAVNFFDKRGNVVDTPPSAIAALEQQRPETKRIESFTQRPTADAPTRQQSQTFCNTCLNNQRMYMESLSNYLPDEDHPRYLEFEHALPQYKKELEERYPQVCKACAPQAQMRMYKADYFGMTQMTGRLLKNTQDKFGAKRGRDRDDWWKWTMRRVLSAAGMVVYATLIVQVAWHAYALFGLLGGDGAQDSPDGSEALDTDVEPIANSCATSLLLLETDRGCREMIGALVRKAIMVRLLLIWHNHGLKDWYHHTYRLEAIHGQQEHFWMQIFLLVVRFVAYSKLSDPATVANMNVQQAAGAHIFIIGLMLITEWISERAIKADRWKIRGKIMPKPEVEDVFGATAGPATQDRTAQASSAHPLKLFAKDERSFPIHKLAPKQSNQESTNTQALWPTDSISDDDADKMDISYDSPARGLQARQTHQPSGWAPLRNEVFGLESQQRAGAERLELRNQANQQKLQYEPTVSQNPFRGTLPPAPMSMERRLRNPPNQVNFRKAPLSKQQNFMAQMREGVEGGKNFSARDLRAERRSEQGQPGASFGAMSLGAEDDTEEDDDDTKTEVSTVMNLSPAKARTRGQLDLRDSGWRLPGDGGSSTGLEDLFAGRSFTIAEPQHTAESGPEHHEGSPGGGFQSWLLGIAVLFLAVMLAQSWLQELQPYLDMFGRLEQWMYGL